MKISKSAMQGACFYLYMDQYMRFCRLHKRSMNVDEGSYRNSYISSLDTSAISFIRGNFAYNARQKDETTK